MATINRHMSSKYSKEGFILFGLVVMGSLLVVVSHHLENELPPLWWSRTLGGLGEAFFIAGVLGLLVDRGLKAALAKDALSVMVGWEVPEKIRESVKELIRLPIVRRGFVITYDISDCETLSGFVRLTSVTQFSVFNLTPRTIDYFFRSCVERSRFEKVRAAKLSNGILEMWVLSNPQDPGTNVFASRSVQVLDNTDSMERVLLTRIPASDERWFKTKREQYYPSSFFVVLDLLPPACEGITVKVRAPLTFEVDVFFGGENQSKREREGDLDVWTSAAVYLPGQHVRVTWSKAIDEPKTILQ
ncbi:MAG: hypothetical protein KF682_18265 [Nitrospira sp.]|nr:hypothetical protein [Nitrospira sp.]